MHQSGWTYLVVLGSLAAIALVIRLMGKLFPGKGHTAAGNALLRAEIFFNPSREHVIEAKEYEETEEGENGDPPEPGA